MGRLSGLIAALVATALFLTGCSTIVGDEVGDDRLACEQLSSLTTPDNLSLELLDTAALASKIRSEAGSVAGKELAARIEQLASELEKNQIDTLALGPIASEIAIRCALAGVVFELPSLPSTLG